MSNPIPLTADPSNPQSPPGAIPVSLFGAGGGGGGETRTAVATIPLTSAEDGGAVQNVMPVDFEHVKVVRTGNVVQLQVIVILNVDDEDGEIVAGSPNAPLGYVPEGFQPMDTGGGVVFGMGSPLDGTTADSGSAYVGGFVVIATGGRIGFRASPHQSLREVQCTAMWITDDPFPESD